MTCYSCAAVRTTVSSLPFWRWENLQRLEVYTMIQEFVLSPTHLALTSARVKKKRREENGKTRGSGS